MPLIGYFGYGANRHTKMMEWITGRPKIDGFDMVLMDAELCIQTVDQIPDFTVVGAPAPISPRQIILDAWGENFSSYVVRPQRGSMVTGRMHLITPEERELVANWELIRFGWYRFATGVAATSARGGNRTNVVTEILGDGQDVFSVVDGRSYETWLNTREKFEQVASEARLEYQLITAQEAEAGTTTPLPILKPYVLTPPVGQSLYL